jgi:hypothetical protein
VTAFEGEPADFLGAVDELLPRQVEALRATRAAAAGGSQAGTPSGGVR